jgi:hypothetical protein
MTDLSDGLFTVLVRANINAHARGLIVMAASVHAVLKCLTVANRQIAPQAAVAACDYFQRMVGNKGKH